MGEYESLRIQLLKTLLQMEGELLNSLKDESSQLNGMTEIKNSSSNLKMDSNELRVVLSVQELSEYLGISTDSVYTMVREQQIPFIRVRRRILFHKESINSWINTLQNN